MICYPETTAATEESLDQRHIIARILEVGMINLWCRETENKIGKVRSLEYTDILKVYFMPDHA